MKRHLSTDRAYREAVRPGQGEVAFKVGVEQTDLLIIAREDMAAEMSAHVTELRGQIKNRILLQPEFATSLTPIDVPNNTSTIIMNMVEAAKLCGVGPMAAVAGSISQAVADKFCDQSPDILVENGGDTYLHSTRDRVVALLADPEGGTSIGLKIEADRFPLAVCSSSGRIGHSLSLGSGDLVTVLAKSGAVADAAATALCNLLGEKSDINRVLEEAQRFAEPGPEKGILGVFAQLDDQIAAWGDLELTQI